MPRGLSLPLVEAQHLAAVAGEEGLEQGEEAAEGGAQGKGVEAGHRHRYRPWGGKEEGEGEEGGKGRKERERPAGKGARERGKKEVATPLFSSRCPRCTQSSSPMLRYVHSQS